MRVFHNIDLEEFQPGDLVTAYWSGIYRFLGFQRRFFTYGQLHYIGTDEHIYRKNIPQHPFAEAEEGDEYSPLAIVIKVMNTKLAPVNGKEEKQCDAFFIKKVTPESLEELAAAEVKKYRSAINYLFPQEKDVHTEHCCINHGCKYGDADCPVETGMKKQSHPCEKCYFEL